MGRAGQAGSIVRPLSVLVDVVRGGAVRIVADIVAAAHLHDMGAGMLPGLDLLHQLGAGHFPLAGHPVALVAAVGAVAISSDPGHSLSPGRPSTILRHRPKFGRGYVSPGASSQFREGIMF